MMIWLKIGGKDAPRSFPPQYEALNTKTMKTPRPFRHAMIWPIFDRNFEHKGKFRQHLGQQVLTKLFSSKSTHQTGQKTYIPFSHISITFLVILHKFFTLVKVHLEITSFINGDFSTWNVSLLITCEISSTFA